MEGARTKLALVARSCEQPGRLLRFSVTILEAHAGPSPVLRDQLDTRLLEGFSDRLDVGESRRDRSSLPLPSTDRRYTQARLAREILRAPAKERAPGSHLSAGDCFQII